MNLTIQRLKLTHFKGISNQTFEFNGEDTNIYGDNASGKTTIFDAFLWLLFGKDSTDRSTFGVKPYDQDGNEIHNLETSVEGLFLLDSKSVSLRHVMTENWVTQRGQSERVFQGNTHSYQIDDQTASATEYKVFIDSLVTEKVFRLITNPLAFNALHWDERRQLLLNLSPVPVDSILLQKEEYAAIARAMASSMKGIDGVKQAHNERRKRLADELKSLPIQIAEVKRMLGDYDEAAVSDADAERESLMSQLADLERQLTDARSIANLYEDEMRKLASARNVLNQYEQNVLANVGSEAAKAKRDVQACKDTLTSVETRIARYTHELENAVSRKQIFDDEVQKLRNQWHEEKAEEITIEQPESTCPSCHQPLPEDEIHAATNKAKELAIYRKENRLKKIADDGKKAASSAGGMETIINDLKKQIDDLRIEHAAYTKNYENACERANAPVVQPDFSADVRWNELHNAVTEQEAKLNSLVDGGSITAEVSDQKNKIMKRLQELAQITASKDKNDLCISRINELEARQRECGEQMAAVEKFIILIEKFVTERCGMLENSINALFPTVRWRLFEVQINTGIKDDCTCMINGVPFSDANNAAKINAGIEIINVLNDYYEATVPVFCDNAESVNQLRQTNGQRIALIVSNDPELRLENINRTMEVA